MIQNYSTKQVQIPDIPVIQQTIPIKKIILARNSLSDKTWHIKQTNSDSAANHPIIPQKKLKLTTTWGALEIDL